MIVGLEKLLLEILIHMRQMGVLLKKCIYSLAILDKEIDRYPSRNYDDTGGKELKTIMTKNNLTDIWREQIRQ